jgi:hypothetical protein
MKEFQKKIQTICMMLTLLTIGGLRVQANILPGWFLVLVNNCITVGEMEGNSCINSGEDYDLCIDYAVNSFNLCVQTGGTMDDVIPQ